MRGEGGHSESPGARRQPPLERRWVVACLILWTLFISIGAWVAGHDGFGWNALSAPVNALTGAFAAVVIGALILQKYQKRIEHEKASMWLDRNLAYALGAQDAMRQTLAEAARISYAVVKQAGVIAAPIDDRFIREDIERVPRPSSELRNVRDLALALSQTLDDLLRQSDFGPLAVAEDQVRHVWKGFLADKLDELPMRRSALGSDSSTEAHPLEGERRLTIEEAQSLLAAVNVRLAGRLEHLAERVLSLTSDMVGIDQFEPNKLRRPAIAMLRSTERIASIAEDARPDTADAVSTAQALTTAIADLLNGASALRKEIWDSTRSLYDVARNVGGTDAMSVVMTGAASAGSFLDTDWETWRRENGYAPSAEGEPEPV
jgi:hypothetical protein